MRYDVRKIDSADAVANKEIVVDAKGIAFLTVPLPIQVRIGSPTAPGIPIHAPTTIESNEVIRNIYISHEGLFDSEIVVMAYDCANVAVGAQALDEFGHVYVRLADRLSYDLDSVTAVIGDSVPMHTASGAPIESRGRVALVAKSTQAAAPAGSTLQLDTGERTILSAVCTLSGAGDVVLEGSDDAATWYELETQTLSGTGSVSFNRVNGWRYVRIRVPDAGLDITRVISAKD